jgi:hypothetical protein
MLTVQPIPISAALLSANEVPAILPEEVPEQPIVPMQGRYPDPSRCLTRMSNILPNVPQLLVTEPQRTSPSLKRGSKRRAFWCMHSTSRWCCTALLECVSSSVSGEVGPRRPDEGNSVGYGQKYRQRNRKGGISEWLSKWTKCEIMAEVERSITTSSPVSRTSLVAST